MAFHAMMAAGFAIRGFGFRVLGLRGFGFRVFKGLGVRGIRLRN